MLQSEELTLPAMYAVMEIHRGRKGNVEVEVCVSPTKIVLHKVHRDGRFHIQGKSDSIAISQGLQMLSKKDFF